MRPTLTWFLTWVVLGVVGAAGLAAQESDPPALGVGEQIEREVADPDPIPFDIGKRGQAPIPSGARR